jgi:hypothetical protein
MQKYFIFAAKTFFLITARGCVSEKWKRRRLIVMRYAKNSDLAAAAGIKSKN